MSSTQKARKYDSARDGRMLAVQVHLVTWAVVDEMGTTRGIVVETFFAFRRGRLV